MLDKVLLISHRIILQQNFASRNISTIHWYRGTPGNDPQLVNIWTFPPIIANPEACISRLSFSDVYNII
jgi:hypothetical protein